MEVKVSAPAKINLSFDIVGKRFDGYHDISTIMQSVSLCDNITVSTKDDNSNITISCSYPDVPCDEKNIVYKAAEKFFEYTKAPAQGIHIDIDKNIPTQAGLAGGSTDGAAVILALNKLFNTSLTISEMCEIGSKVGADVPFCIVGGIQHATGTGTKLSKLVKMPKCHIVICKPEISVSTAQAYAKIDEMPPKGFFYTDEAIKSLFRRNIRMLSACLYNDFEVALELEEINNIKRTILKNKAQGACMTGSGSAVFGLFISEKHAHRCVDALKQQYKDVFLCKPISTGCTVK